jgi:asparagine synthase (glutamine-hydrolysing)
MCGFAGLLSLKGSHDPAYIRSMMAVLKHRGPDDEGYLAVNVKNEPMTATSLAGRDTVADAVVHGEPAERHADLWLGHRRLAIVDVSAAGHQPMRYREHLWIVFNGEIYNYLELSDELKGAGYEFETQTDTEVILAAYHHWGTGCVTRFNGDWAFCILDARRKELFLSRDRYGVKPLYVFRNDRHLTFASEIKALLCLPFVPCALNLERCRDYLGEHAEDHTNETMFDCILQLPPGKSMCVDLRRGTAIEKRYYSLASPPETGRYEHGKATRYVADIRDLLFDSIKLRLRADVPIGACLSGGLDSSVVTAIAAKLLGKESARTFNTFTSCFPGQPIDETRFARSVAEFVGVRGHLVYPSAEGFRRSISKIQAHQDEPIGGASLYAQWEVMTEASKHVKVMLDGQGGDEVFAGYKNYRLSLLATLFAEGRFSSLARELWATVIHAGSITNGIKDTRALPIYVLRKRTKSRIYALWQRQELKFAADELRSQRNPEFDHALKSFTGDVSELLADFMTYSLVHLLKVEDRNSMAHSVEARVPFMDHRLVDYLFQVPAIYKIRHGWTKWLLRLAAKDLLPEPIVWRKDKLGFPAPCYTSRQELWSLWIAQFFPESQRHPTSATAIAGSTSPELIGTLQ